MAQTDHNQLNTSTDYLPVVTSLRGLAATAVCWYHFIWSTVDYIEQEQVRALAYYGQYGVHLFFLISGLVLPLSLLRRQYHWQQFPTFLWRRLLRLEPPYLVSVLLAVVYLVLQSYRHQTTVAVSWYALLAHIGYWVPWVSGVEWFNPVYWSLAVEFQYYLFLALCFPLFQWSWTRYLLVIAMLSLPFYSFEKELLLRWLPIFLLGINMALYRKTWIRAAEYWTIMLLSLVSIAYFFDPATVVILCIGCSLIITQTNWSPKFLEWLGERSYALYLLHLITGQVLINVLSHHFDTPWQKVLVLCSGFMLSLAAANVLYRWVERPFQAYAKKH